MSAITVTISRRCARARQSRPAQWAASKSTSRCRARSPRIVRPRVRRPPPPAQGILWTAAAERYSRGRSDWVRPSQFRVPDDVVEASRTQWDFWTQPQLPADLARLITDDILDEFALAGTAEECAARLALDPTRPARNYRACVLRGATRGPQPVPGICRHDRSIRTRDSAGQ